LENNQHDWDVTGCVPEKPGAGDYGYVIRDVSFGCSREDLVKALRSRGSDIRFVWTPETPELVFPEKVPFLLDTFRKLAAKNARNAILIGLGLFAVGGVIAYGSHVLSLLYRNILAVFGALVLVEGVWQWVRTRHYTLADAEADGSGFRFAAWIKKKRLTGYGVCLAAFIIGVLVVQGFDGAEQSINRAGLVKPAVWQGQLWRLLTACLMHVNFMHFWMNFLALLYFARVIEQTIHRAYVPLIFLVAGLCGSLFSLVLYPHTTSVGASGGLMGLLGFITMDAYFDRTKYPPKYLRNLIEAIVFVGIFGLVGFAFIDNAAHLGGLCGGLLLGWALLRGSDKPFGNEKFEKRVAFLGAMALVVLGLGVVAAVWQIIR
jgi:membrane associated rhomboid family serine protease